MVDDHGMKREAGATRQLRQSRHCPRNGRRVKSTAQATAQFAREGALERSTSFARESGDRPQETSSIAEGVAAESVRPR